MKISGATISIEYEPKDHLGHGTAFVLRDAFNMETSIPLNLYGVEADMLITRIDTQFDDNNKMQMMLYLRNPKS